MILQALYEYAQRKGDALPEDGFENIELKYLIRIKEDGSLVRIESTEEKIKQENGKDKSVWKTFNKVPKHVARTAAPKASLLIDNVGYVLGIPKVEKDEKKIKKAEESAKIQNELFIKAIEDLPENVRQEKEINAVIKFYRDNKENGFDKIILAENYEELKKCLGNISFVLLGNSDIVAQNEKVREYQRQQTALQLESSDDDSEKNISTVTTMSYPITNDDEVDVVEKEISENKSSLNDVMNNIRYDLIRNLLTILLTTYTDDMNRIITRDVSDLSFTQQIAFNTLLNKKIIIELTKTENE